MAQIIQDNEQRLVCRVETVKLWAGALFAALGVAVALGLLRHSHGSHPFTLWDRLSEVGMGVIAVLVGLAVAGPEDLLLDFTSRTYRARSGLRFFARWREGPFSNLEYLELRKKRRASGWQVQLVFSDPPGATAEITSLTESGSEGRDPRLLAHRLMEGLAARLGVPALDNTGHPLVLEASPSFPVEQAQPAAAPVVRTPVPLQSELRTRRYRISPAPQGFHLAKSRWFILENEWEMVLWGAMAGSVLGYILINSGLLWRAPGEIAGAVMKAIPEFVHPASPAEYPLARQNAVLGLVVAGVLVFVLLLAFLAWARLLRAAWKVSRGEKHVFDWKRDRVTYNGLPLCSISEIQSMDVREYVGSGGSRRRVWHSLSLILIDTRRTTLVLGDYEELAQLGQTIAGALGVEAIAS